jgi:long-subunit fatty acid transport protein
MSVFAIKKPALVLILTITTFFINNLIFAAGTSSAQFLKLGAGARAAGMGDAFTSISDDVTAAYWNPAGLAQIKKTELSMMHNTYLVDTQYQFLGAAFPVKSNTVAFSFFRLDHGDIDEYSGSDVKIGSFDAGSTAINISFARKISEGFLLGVSGKYVSENIDSEKASTFAGDIGLLLTQGKFNFGLSLQHLGGGLTFVQEESPLPQTFRLGTSTKFLNEKLLAALDFSKPQDDSGTLHLGAEFRALSAIALRGGYQTTPGNQLDVSGLKGISGGLGATLGLFTLDYAFIPFGDLGNTHKISALIKFK